MNNKIVELKNQLEETRSDSEVLHNEYLLKLLDKGIDELEDNDSAVYVGSRLYLKIREYEFGQDFKVPQVIKNLEAKLANYGGAGSSSLT